MQKKFNSSALAMELHLYCMKPSIQIHRLERMVTQGFEYLKEYQIKWLKEIIELRDKTAPDTGMIWAEYYSAVLGIRGPPT